MMMAMRLNFRLKTVDRHRTPERSNRLSLRALREQRSTGSMGRIPLVRPKLKSLRNITRYRLMKQFKRAKSRRERVSKVS